MKTLEQLFALLDHFDNGHADFKEKLAAYARPMRRLYKLEVNRSITTDEPSSDYNYVFESEDYKYHQLTTLKVQLREALNDFIELKILHSSAAGQNLLADFHEKYGDSDKAKQANKTAIQLAPSEAEEKRWLSCFQAHKALHFSGEKGHLKKALQNLRLFFLVNYLKLTIEELTIFRIEDKKSLVKETIRQQIKQVFALSPFSKPPIIDIQTKAVEYYLNQEFEQYKAFKTAFLGKVDLVDSDKNHLLASLLNAIVLYPNPSENIIHDYLPIYKTAIEKNLYSYDKKLDLRTICNILLIADQFKDYELAKLTSKKLIPHLPIKKERIWCSLLAEIYILYGTEKYSLALKKIKQLDNENCIVFDITFRKNILKLKCRYEVSGHSPSTYNSINEAKRNFEKLLKRNFENNNINALTKICCTNFINFLIMVSNTHNIKYTKVYLLEILASYNGEIMETNWLKKIIAERPF